VSSPRIPLKTKIFWTLLIVIVCLNIAILITGNSYMYKALVYTYAGIDDLDLFATREIEHSQGEPWPVAPDYNQKKLSPALRTALEKWRTVAFLVLRDDSIRYEEYWDRYDTSSLSNSFSAAKSFIGTLVGIAVDEGKIRSIDDSVTHYLPWFGHGEDHGLTIRQLLTMSAGLNWDESYSSLFSVTTKAYYGNDLGKLARTLKVVDTPGKVFNYQSGCTVLLAMIVEKAAGMPVARYASEKLWKPLGAEFTAQWSLDHYDGLEKAYCCIYASARDFARLGQLYLDSGAWHGRQVVSKAWVAASTTPAPILDDDGTPNEVYGFQWWMTEYQGHRIFYARGLNGQYILVVPDLRVVMVRLGFDRDGAKPKHHLVDLDIYIEELIRMVAPS
jgi:CubicO group peptidase (beta-lactamase class C family)